MSQLPPIAFVSRSDAASEASWIQALSEALPQETIISFSAMSDDEKQRAEIAIVANPDPEHIAALPNLKWVHSLWAGVERLVAELGPKAPPLVRLVDPELSRVMAEAVLAWSYYLQRDMPTYQRQQQQRIWQELEYRHPSELTVGLIGLGELGAASARKLKDAGFNVIGWSRSVKSLAGIETVAGEEGLNTVLQRSDIVVCLVPLTEQTRGLLNTSRFEIMKKGASLINFARGPIVVIDDLLNALDNGQLSHAVLDVFEVEPLPDTSTFWDHEKVTVLPHISGPTSRGSSARIVAGNIRNWRQNGTLPSTVDVQRGY
jgi:glyoxylate/hydroxypyruvate reductase